MRISDWSSDVCSSDLHLAIDHDEGQPEQEPGRTPGEGLRELLPDVALPRPGLRLAVHPDADREENRRREQCAEAFRQFAARAAHRSEEHTSELQSLMRISYSVFCLKKTNYTTTSA